MTETPEQTAQHYSAAMDSVNLINTLKAKATLTEEEADTMARNKDHLLTVLAKTCWTTEDLTPFKNAATA